MENNEKELEERELKELELMNENENREFYVYLHIRLDNMTPFYVGKGTKNRAYKSERNLHHDNICDACGYKVVTIKDNLTESQAFKLENKMINYYVFMLDYGIDIEGYNDYDHALPHLTNCTFGGEGTSGYKHSEESKQRMSESHKGKHLSEEHKQNLSESHKGIQFSEEHKQNLSESHKGIQFSEEHKQNLSKAKIGEKHPMWGKPALNRSKVICITTGVTFDSMKEASDWYNVAISNISRCCRGTRKHAGKLNGVLLQWKYAENDDNESKESK